MRIGNNIGEREGDTLVQVKVKGEGKIIPFLVYTESHEHTQPHCFLTAYRMTSHPSVLAGTLDSKNPTPYY